MEALHALVGKVNSLVWGPPMLILLVGTHLFLTFRLRFIQSYMFKAIKLSLTKDVNSEGDISQFGALATALAATIGTGNIVGVATAVATGGPGAVLWCWLTGLFGIATKYAEGLLAVKYRVKTSDGTMLGGPMYALERGLDMRWLGILFAAFTVIASFGIGNMTQANSITSMLSNSFGIKPLYSGMVITICAAVVIIGGVRSIAKVCEALVPLMALFYILGCIVVLAANASFIPAAIKTIFVAAFTPRAAAGGFVGSTIMLSMRYGIARGLFSNESGLGSAPIAAAAAQTSNPVRQALVSMTGVFWDTIIVCALTGLVLTTSIMKYPNLLGGLTGAALTSSAFGQVSVFGKYILAVGLVTFAFSTILGWSYYGEKAFEYLFGKQLSKIYRFVYCLIVMFGSVVANAFVWDVSDTFNALMAIPNLVSLILLSPIIVSETKKYLWENKLDTVDDSPIPLISDK
ncbi:MAG: sodium:alanine symporter family protein [Peptostreptococcaceae bacterium]|nr:sodium:alanine symporter family protein [Peptostreptococcaceae bacterium]